MQKGRSFHVLRMLLNFAPSLPQGLCFGLHLRHRRKECGVTNDDPETAVRNALAHLPRAGAVIFIRYAAAEAHKAVLGHEQHILPRQADIACQKGALLALGVLFHLHQHILPGQKRRVSAGTVIAFSLAQGQKTILCKPQLDKRCLHVGQYALYPAQEHRAHQAFRARVLLIELQKARFIQQSDARGFPRALNQQPERTAHAQTSSMGTSVPSGVRARMAVR